jgi:hypothetical protein
VISRVVVWEGDLTGSKTMNEISVDTWEECEAEIAKIEDFNRNSSIPACFRGHADAKWSLTTTLERRTTTISLFTEYYRIMRVIKPVIETFTNFTWEIPEFDAVNRWAMDYDAHRDPNQKVLSYDYMAHLRHNGFPSPLLDWTRSPYVAAFFAFQNLRAIRWQSMPLQISLTIQNSHRAGNHNFIYLANM